MNFRLVSLLAVMILVAGGASAQNLVQNPGFDGDTTSWTPLSSSDVIASYSAEDAGGDPASGSASVTNLHPQIGTALSGYSQCISILSGAEYRIGATVKIAAGQGTPGDGGVTVYWYSGPTCDSWISGLSVDSDVTGGWTRTIDFRTAPAGAASAMVFVKVYKLDAGGSLNALIDDVIFEPVLFQDGFENGDFLGWSVVSP